MTYPEKASEIIKESIKSAIFVDENAVEFYTTKPNDEVPEELLSKNLYTNFKDLGISLAVSKFDLSKIKDPNYLNFLFKKRDLVLLDWKLAGNEGEDFSLSLLSEIVDSNHLHFCSIYTSERNNDEILNNIRSYFSGYDTDYYITVKEVLGAFEAEILNIVDRISFEEKENGKMYPILINIDAGLPGDIINATGINDLKLAVIQVKLAYLDLHKSNRPLPVPTYIDTENHTVNIDSTIISIINKDEDSAVKIIDKIVEKVLSSPNHFMELLGLDMQNNFSQNSSFIDTSLLDLSFNTLLFHRGQILDHISEEEFKNFIISLLNEHSKTTLLKSNLQILDHDFLESESQNIISVTDNDLGKLNTFYNGSVVKNKLRLNFGDIFIDEENNESYLCITPLCDCLHPENIKNNFFFVKGEINKNLKQLIESDDSWFKSYIGNDTGVLWAKGVDYIKPVQMNITEPKFKEKNIRANTIKNDALLPIILTYKFSLKTSYAQRIANHAFNHPIRVGVDFVKSKSSDLSADLITNEEDKPEAKVVPISTEVIEKKSPEEPSVDG